MKPTIRDALESDIPAMTAIYAYHVLNGTASFEERAPSEREIRERWQARQAEGFPTLVAEADGRLLGYAYVTTYKPRSAYRFTVEDSIYIAENARGQGVGKRLLDALLQRCREQGYRQVMAVIGDSDNSSSVALHARAGFEHIGTARAIGYKFERWLDVVYMQKSL